MEDMEGIGQSRSSYYTQALKWEARAPQHTVPYSMSSTIQLALKKEYDVSQLFFFIFLFVSCLSFEFQKGIFFLMQALLL